MLNLGLVQPTTGTDPARNAADLAAAVDALARDGAAIVFTPEMSNLVQRDSRRLAAAVTAEADDPVLAAMQQAARRNAIPIALGSIAVRERGRLVNRSMLIGADGVIRARYDKIHLFDVDLAGGERYRESATFTAGRRAVVAACGWGGLGLSICYDLRFPLLYAALAQAGAMVLAVPAAFTVPTGRAHWHVLLRARAIETGCFVVAAAQTGRHADGRETFGHSLVVGPWGEVVADLGEAPGRSVVGIDLAEVAAARARVPTLAHARRIGRPVVLA